MNKICYGCGAKIQSEDKEKKGYVPKSKENPTYCMRCFRMINYGENKSVSTPKEAKEIINKINKDDKFVIFLVDYLNINKEVISIFKKIKKKKVFIVNKCELIPRYISREKIKDFLISYYDIKEDIILKGGVSSHGARSIMKYLKDANIKESYILGISNSGKSTLINDLMDLNNTNLTKITVNNKANTTLDFIRVKINDELTLIDSPGFIINNYLNVDTSGKNIVSYSINMKAGETVGILDNTYFIKVEDATPIVFYTNLKTNKVIRKYFRAAPNLVNMIEGENIDIIIYGIGFITVKKKTKITTNIDLNNLEVRDSIFGGKYE